MTYLDIPFRPGGRIGVCAPKRGRSVDLGKVGTLKKMPQNLQTGPLLLQQPASWLSKHSSAASATERPLEEHPAIRCFLQSIHAHFLDGTWARNFTFILAQVNKHTQPHARATSEHTRKALETMISKKILACLVFVLLIEESAGVYAQADAFRRAARAADIAAGPGGAGATWYYQVIAGKRNTQLLLDTGLNLLGKIIRDEVTEPTRMLISQTWNGWQSFKDLLTPVWQENFH